MGNAALAVRAPMLFERLCLDLDVAKTRSGAQALGFRRAAPAASRAVLGGQPGEVWIHAGYDNYFVAFRAESPASCELGVHLATAEQIEAPFAAMVVRLRQAGYAASPVHRLPQGIASFRLVAPDGARRDLLIVPVNDPGSPIRSLMVAMASPG